MRAIMYNLSEYINDKFNNLKVDLVLNNKNRYDNTSLITWVYIHNAKN